MSRSVAIRRAPAPQASTEPEPALAAEAADLQAVLKWVTDANVRLGSVVRQRHRAAHRVADAFTDSDGLQGWGRLAWRAAQHAWSLGHACEALVNVFAERAATLRAPECARPPSAATPIPLAQWRRLKADTLYVPARFLPFRSGYWCRREHLHGSSSAPLSADIITGGMELTWAERVGPYMVAVTGDEVSLIRVKTARVVRRTTCDLKTTGDSVPLSRLGQKQVEASRRLAAAGQRGVAAVAARGV